MPLPPPPPHTNNIINRIFADDETTLPDISTQERKRFIQRLQSLTIFDPCVGSGAFLLGITNALSRAIKKLDHDTEDPTRSIIQNQLFGQDINPMATQITRLRLFIAIIAAERDAIDKPLPNLEGRIICADTLANVANPDWHPNIALGITGTDEQIRKALNERSEVLKLWRYAHSEDEKRYVQEEDEKARLNLLKALRVTSNDDHPELMSFAKHEVLAADAEPVSTDTRLLFYDPDWQGFDIVIGNPPYERIAEVDSPEERQQFKKHLREQKRYRTTRGNNLYNLFCEVALALAKRENGVVTFIVPLSLSCAQTQKHTRDKFEYQSKKIWLRHQDNRPDKTFHASPVSSPESRQRTTIITAVLGKSNVEILTTGTAQWHIAERDEFLRYRHYTKTNPYLDQWPRIPSEFISMLVSKISCQDEKIQQLARPGDEFQIGLPNSAYNFITVIPSKRLARGEKVFNVRDIATLELVVSALNCHAAYAWWRVLGNSFTISKKDLMLMSIPDKWINEDETNRKARRLGRALIDAITPENITRNRSGTRGNTFENINFHEVCPDIIREIDELYLDALGMMDETLLHQLHKLRSNSNWRL